MQIVNFVAEGGQLEVPTDLSELPGGSDEFGGVPAFVELMRRWAPAGQHSSLALPVWLPPREHAAAGLPRGAQRGRAWARPPRACCWADTLALLAHPHLPGRPRRCCARDPQARPGCAEVISELRCVVLRHFFSSFAAPTACICFCGWAECQVQLVAGLYIAHFPPWYTQFCFCPYFVQAAAAVGAAPGERQCGIRR